MIPAGAASRARGLQSRLLSRSALVELASATDVAEWLAERGLVPWTARAPLALERALRRVRADRLAILGRWCGDMLPLVFLDEDRRSLIFLLRRARAGRSSLEGLIPTPTLPERVLATLAEQDTAGLVALLVAWRHPLGRHLAAAESLPEREQAIHRAFFRLAPRGHRVVRHHLRLLVDVANAQALAVGRDQPATTRDPDAWIPGGEAFDRARYAAVLEGVRPLALNGFPDLSDRGVLVTLLGRLRRQARLEPLGSAPVLYFALRLRAEAIDLRTVLWGRALGTPPGALLERLVTP